MTGIKDAEFVHKTGFTGAAWSKESAIKMVELSLTEYYQRTGSKPTKKVSKKHTVVWF